MVVAEAQHTRSAQRENMWPTVAAAAAALARARAEQDPVGRPPSPAPHLAVGVKLLGVALPAGAAVPKAVLVGAEVKAGGLGRPAHAATRERGGHKACTAKRLGSLSCNATMLERPADCARERCADPWRLDRQSRMQYDGVLKWQRALTGTVPRRRP